MRNCLSDGRLFCRRRYCFCSCSYSCFICVPLLPLPCGTFTFRRTFATTLLLVLLNHVWTGGRARSITYTLFNLPALVTQSASPASFRRTPLFGQAAYHSVRDSYQFTAELRKVLRSLPPRAALAACQALRPPPSEDADPALKSARGAERGNGVYSAGWGSSGLDSAEDSDNDDELPYMTQVMPRRACVRTWFSSLGR